MLLTVPEFRYFFFFPFFLGFITYKHITVCDIANNKYHTKNNLYLYKCHLKIKHFLCQVDFIFIRTVCAYYYSEKQFKWSFY